MQAIEGDVHDRKEALQASHYFPAAIIFEFANEVCIGGSVGHEKSS